MATNLFGSFLKDNKKEQFVSVDIGTSTIKLMELDVSGSRPRLLNAATGATPGGCISNNMITKPDAIAAVIRSLLEANDIKSPKAVIGIPGPAAFSKKVVLGASKVEDLAKNIAFEATNYIPHKIDAVHLDFQVLRPVGSSNMEVLLVAVKNEIIRSFLETVEQAGLEPAIADVDHFALENMFELNYPEELKRTVALVDVGARYTGVSIVQDGQSLFTGDVGVGGRLYTDALCESLGMQAKQAEDSKLGRVPEGFDRNLVTETLERTTEHVTSELHRQIGFFWNAAATNRTIDAVYLTGGGAQTPGLIEQLNAKTGIECKVINPFERIDAGSSIDKDFLAEIAPHMAVSVGLALRRHGDKKHAIQ